MAKIYGVAWILNKVRHPMIRSGGLRRYPLDDDEKRL